MVVDDEFVEGEGCLAKCGHAGRWILVDEGQYRRSKGSTAVQHSCGRAQGYEREGKEGKGGNDRGGVGYVWVVEKARL